MSGAASDDRRGTSRRGWFAVGIAVAARPGLWPTVIRQWRRTTPRGWWRRPPFLPMPTRDYRAFRMVTQYGRADHPPTASDVLNYLTWCKQVEQ